MSLTTKQEHVTTTCALCMISKRHKQRWFHSASPRPRDLCIWHYLASPRLRTLLPCLASASTSLPWPLPLPRQNCLEPIPAYPQGRLQWSAVATTAKAIRVPVPDWLTVLPNFVIICQTHKRIFYGDPPGEKNDDSSRPVFQGHQRSSELTRISR